MYLDQNWCFSYDDLLENPLGLPNSNLPRIVHLTNATPVEILANIVFYFDYDLTLIIGGELLNQGNISQDTAQKNGLKLGIFTSGTTGNPKLIFSNASELIQKSKSSKKKMGKKRIWGLLFDPEKMSGLQVLLHCWQNSESLVCPPANEKIASKIDFMIQHKVSALSATPSQWKHLLKYPSIHSLELTQITLGGEKSDLEILQKIRKAFPSATITQIYASTEFGKIFSVRDNLPGFPTSFLNQTSTRRVVTIDSENNLLIEKDGKWVKSGDTVRVEENRVYFENRSDAIINVGGEKVDPARVLKELKLIPSISDAYVSSLPSSVLGNLVVADVVVNPGEIFSESDLKKKLAQRLRKIEIPAFINQVDEIAINSNGKPILSA